MISRKHVLLTSKTTKRWLTKRREILKTSLVQISKNKNLIFSVIFIEVLQNFPAVFRKALALACTNRVRILRTRHQASRCYHVNNARRSHYEFVPLCILLRPFLCLRKISKGKWTSKEKCFEPINGKQIIQFEIIKLYQHNMLS